MHGMPVMINYILCYAVDDDKYHECSLCMPYIVYTSPMPSRAQSWFLPLLPAKASSIDGPIRPILLPWYQTLH